MAPTRSKQVDLYEAKSYLSRLVKEAAAGMEIIIAKAGEPMARLGSAGPGNEADPAAWAAKRAAMDVG